MLPIEIIIVLLISLLGLLKSYEENGASAGNDFVARAVCLSFPIGIKVEIIAISLSWMIYYAFPSLIDPMTFRDPEKIWDLIEFIWAPAYTAIFFWRLWVAFRIISIHERR